MKLDETKKKIKELINEAVKQIDEVTTEEKEVYCKCCKSTLSLDPNQQMLNILNECGEKCVEVISKEMNDGCCEEKTTTVVKKDCCCDGQCNGH